MHWKYKAYDEKFNIIEGSETANTFIELALKLRQEKGLQIIEAEKLDQNNIFIDKQLNKLRMRVNTIKPSSNDISKKPIFIVRFIKWLIKPLNAVIKHNQDH